MVAAIPLFLLREGRLVRQDGPRAWTPVTRSAEETVGRVKQHARPEVFVYLLDVDGVEAGAADLEFYQQLERAHVLAWIQPGCRTTEDVMDAFFAGAEAVTVEPRLMDQKQLEDLAEIAEGEIHLGFRFVGKAPEPPMRAAEMARLAEHLFCAGIVLEVAPGSDDHQLQAFVLDVASHRVSVSLLDRRGTGAPPPPWTAGVVTHFISPGPAP